MYDKSARAACQQADERLKRVGHHSSNMTRIAYQSCAHDRIVQEGDISGDGPWLLETSHLNRPNYRVEMDGSITLITANQGTEIEDFAELLIP